MPTYEYECRACSQRVEVFQKMTDDPLTECESCGGSLRKLLFPAGIIFKGSGFYVTDYKNKENGKSTSSTSSTSSDANGSTKPSSDTGSAKTSEKKETTATTKTD
jgi:putative FmdB family regulatory protein